MILTVSTPKICLNWICAGGGREAIVVLTVLKSGELAPLQPQPPDFVEDFACFLACSRKGNALTRAALANSPRIELLSITRTRAILRGCAYPHICCDDKNVLCVQVIFKHADRKS